ncbi:MAG: hypothetical protein FJ404_03225 [Verrucomicrobia bacterium]|nr:hypothetical protein [Verrucomicrobiota bacterium]
MVLSDGECNEGSTWEAALFAAAQGLENLVAIVDYNRIQSVGRTDDLNGGASFEDQFRAFGWGARTVDGHDFSALLEGLHRMPYRSGRPSVLVARTTAGKGVSRMEDQVLWHYRTPSGDDLRAALEELGVSPLKSKNERLAA